MGRTVSYSTVQPSLPRSLRAMSPPKLVQNRETLLLI
jgi:hypothetical protein